MAYPRIKLTVVLAGLMLFVGLACNALAGVGPEVDTSPAATASPSDAQTPAAGGEGWLGRTLDSVPDLPAMERIEASGASIAEGDSELAAALSQMGATAQALRVELAFQVSPDGPGLRVGAVTIEGHDWSAVLQQFGSRTGLVLAPVSFGSGSGYRVDPAQGEAEFGPVYYAPAGHSLVFIQGGDETQAERILSAVTQQGSSPGVRGRAGLARRTRQDVGPLILIPMATDPGAVCVGDSRPRHLLNLLIMDAVSGVPSPANIVTVQTRLGRLQPQVDYSGPNLIAYYLAERYDGSQFDGVLLEARTPYGGYGTFTYNIPVAHCLGGSWQDDERILEINHGLGGQVRAEVAAGQLCGEEGGSAFSGLLDGDRLSGSDLKVCSPDDCVEAGLLPASELVDYEAQVAPDGQSVSFEWQGDFFEIEYDDGGNATLCTVTSVEQHQFSISRLDFE